METNPITEKDYQEWIRKADDDLLSLRSMIKHQDAAPSTGCFLAQQVIEKLLKALLSFHKLEVEKTHDIVKLANALQQNEPEISEFIEELGPLNRYYIETRYPGEFPEFTWQECQQALETTEKIRTFVLSRLE